MSGCERARAQCSLAPASLADFVFVSFCFVFHYCLISFLNGFICDLIIYKVFLLRNQFLDLLIISRFFFVVFKDSWIYLKTQQFEPSQGILSSWRHTSGLAEPQMYVRTLGNLFGLVTVESPQLLRENTSLERWIARAYFRGHLGLYV